jgi:hypothetical protein
LITLLIVSVILEIVLSVWWLVVTLIALGEVQHISTWKTLGVLLLILMSAVILGMAALAVYVYMSLK